MSAGQGYRWSEQPYRIGEGRNPPTRKLTEEAVADLKRDVAAGERTIDIAARYGIRAGTVRAIKRGEMWGWVVASL